jgi:hypothetical protein
MYKEAFEEIKYHKLFPQCLVMYIDYAAELECGLRFFLVTPTTFILNLITYRASEDVISDVGAIPNLGWERLGQCPEMRP